MAGPTTSIAARFNARGPAIQPALAPTSHDFGSIGIGSTRGFAFTLSAGSSPLKFIRVYALGGPEFQVGKNCPNSLPAGGACVIVVFFRAVRPGLRMGVLTVRTLQGTAFRAALRANAVVG